MWQNGLGCDCLQNIRGVWKRVATTHTSVRFRSTHSRHVHELLSENPIASNKRPLTLQQHSPKLFPKNSGNGFSRSTKHILAQANLFLMARRKRVVTMKIVISGKLWCQTTRRRSWNHLQLPKRLTFVSVTWKVWRQTETIWTTIRQVLNCCVFYWIAVISYKRIRHDKFPINIIIIFYCGLMVHIIDTRAKTVVSYTSAHIAETVLVHDQHWEEQSTLSSPQLYRHSQEHRKCTTIQ